MCFINQKDHELFNYMYPKDSISNDFFYSSKLFKNSMSPLEKAEYIINYLESKYLLITPIVLRDVFRLIGVQEELAETEYLNLMNSIFGKESINLRNWRERAIFKNFLTNEKDIHKINNEEKVKSDFDNMMNQRNGENLKDDLFDDDLFPKLNKNKEVVDEKKSSEKNQLVV